jgi:hypothetical protein
MSHQDRLSGCPAAAAAFTVAIDKYYPAGDRQVVGEDLDLVRLGSIQLDDGAAAQPHYLMDGHGCGAEDHHQIDADVIEGWHRKKT